MTQQLDSTNQPAPWQWQLKQAIRTPQQLLTALSIDVMPDEAVQAARRQFPLLVPQAFVEKMTQGDPNDPLLRQVWPAADELIEAEGYVSDPLQEHDAQVPGLIHKYHSRVLLIVRGGCAVNCRYCFRRHFPYQDNKPTAHRWQPALDYILAKPQINEVILSGGDPLMANDEQLDQLLDRLEQIPHLKRLRIHSRLPVVIPDRLTTALCQRLARSRLKVTMVLHINHANEVDASLVNQLQPYRQAGIWLLNQSVLLAGVNDSAQVLCDLSEALAEADIQPYYLHLLDPVAGAAHFDVPEQTAKALMAELMKRLPGFLVPKLVREIAGKSSKTPIHLGSSG